jgi:FKBP-type peptidyl-prolyl cis-trans isomerase FkpA
LTTLKILLKSSLFILLIKERKNMRGIVIALLITLIVTPAFAANPPKTEEEKTLYAVGLAVARQTAVFNFTPTELEMVKQGLTDGTLGKTPALDLNDYSKKIQELALARRAAQGEKLAAAGREYLEKAAKAEGAVKTESGLVYQSLREGNGASPAASDTVKVNYRGTLVDGQEFDSSYKRNQPAEFPLNSVIKCWTEGLQKMKVGGKARLLCPPTNAYGDKGAGAAIPPNATLIFEVELLEIKK